MDAEISGSGVSDEDESDSLEPSDSKFDPHKNSSENVASSSAAINGSHVQLNHHNYPVLCEVYKDPNTQLDMVNLAIDLPGGAKNVQFDLNNEGTTCTITYNWPKVMYDFNDMFKKLLDDKTMEPTDPRIVSFKNGLQNVRTRIDVAPTASTTITLPIKVQTTSESFTKGGVTRPDGTLVMLAKFSGYAKDYNKKIRDSTVIFDL